MNAFTFAELSALSEQGGGEQSFTVTVTKAMMQQFLQITGDANPLHTDAVYAKSAGQKDVLVYGLLTTSFYSTLAGMYLPGKYCLLQEVSTQFTKPVFVGDTLTISGRIAELQDTFKRIVIKARITNQSGSTVNRATITAGVLR